jgi:hypothetical protein
LILRGPKYLTKRMRYRSTSEHGSRPKYRGYMCHLTDDSAIYLLSKTMRLHSKPHTFIELMNYQEINYHFKSHDISIIVIQEKQFNEIMALFNEPRHLNRYLTEQGLLKKIIRSYPRESSKRRFISGRKE